VRPAGLPFDEIDGQPTRGGGGATDEVQQAANAGEGWSTMCTEADNARRNAADVLSVTSHPVDLPCEGPLWPRAPRTCRPHPAPPGTAHPVGSTPPSPNRADTVRMGRRGRSALMWGPCGGCDPPVADRPERWCTWPSDRP